MDGDEPLYGDTDDDEGGAGVEYLGEREEDGDKVGMDLVPVGVVEEGPGEDEDVEEDADDIRDAEKGDEVCKKLLELEFCGYYHTDRHNIAWKNGCSECGKHPTLTQLNSTHSTRVELRHSSYRSYTR